jgi:hypothetical protein
VSYKGEAREIPKPRAGVKIEDQVEAFPKPIIADEIHIRPKEKEKKKEDIAGGKAKELKRKITWQEIAWLAAKITCGIVVFIFLLPLLYLLFRLLRISFSRDAIKRTDQIYQASLYRFHMAGIERDVETPLEYATTKVDPILQSGFGNFMRIYLRLKYSKANLRPEDTTVINQFAEAVGSSIRKKFGVFRIILNYFNILLALRYFQQPEKSEHEIPQL